MTIPTLRFRKLKRDWFMVGKPMTPPPPIMLPHFLYVIAMVNGVDMRGYAIQMPIPRLPAASPQETPSSQGTEIAPNPK